MSALRALLDDNPLDTIAVSPPVTEVAEAQAQIGWEQILKGRFAKSWSSLQDRHLGDAKSNTENGQSWMTGLIQIMLQQWFHLWQVRNGDRHGHDWKTTMEAEKRQTIREITQAYEQYKGNLVPEDEWLFNVPLLTRIQQPTHAMRQWLNSWLPKMKKSYETRLETG